MNLKPAQLLIALWLIPAVAACGPAVTGEPTSGVEPIVVATETVPAAAPTAMEATAMPADEIAEDVPIIEGALELTVTGGGSSITYQAPNTTVEKMVEFYATELEARGWQRVNQRDSGFGDSITLLRKKPDRNISVTLQSIAGSPNVRVLITLISK